MEGLTGKITSSLHESNLACYNYINGITSTADEYNFTSYNCISNIIICGRTVEEDYPATGLHILFEELSTDARPIGGLSVKVFGKPSVANWLFFVELDTLNMTSTCYCRVYRQNSLNKHALE